MNSLKQLFFALLGFLLLAAIGVGLYLLVKAMWNAFAALNPQMGAALVTGFFTITVSISAVALGRYLEKAKEVEVAYRDKRLKVYEDFVDRFFALTAESVSEDQKQKEFTQFLRDFNKKMILWGGSRTVHTYVAMMHRMADDATAAKSVFSMETFYQAMRRDLGLDNRAIEKGDLLALLIRSEDLRRFLAASKTNPNVRFQDVSKK
jgi:hypothetical protein